MMLIGFGGILANLRGFIDANGGHVLGMTTLTETRAARKIPLHPDTFDMLRSKHGRELEQFWLAAFGHGIDRLTNVEAGCLCPVESVATLTVRMAQAAEFACSRGLWPVSLSAPPIDQPPN